MRIVCLLTTVAVFTLCCTHSPSTPQETHTLTGDLRFHKDFHSQLLSQNRDLVVYLPPGYDAEAPRRYPVLYMQDGQNLFDASTSFFSGQEWHMDETAQALISSGDVEPLIIVGIYSLTEGRIDDYTLGKESSTNRGGKADLYASMVVEELKPFIDSHYRVLTDPRDTGVGGSSLGAKISLYIGLKYPQIFGKVAMFSPAPWKGILLGDVQSLKLRPKLRIWLDVGTGEGPEFINTARSFRDAFVEAGWKLGEDLKYTELEGAKHDPDGWARRCEPMLRFLFPKNEATQ